MVLSISYLLCFTSYSSCLSVSGRSCLAESQKPTERTGERSPPAPPANVLTLFSFYRSTKYWTALLPLSEMILFLIIGQKSWINGMQWSDWSAAEHGWDSHLTVMVDHRWYLYRLPLPWWELALFLVSFLLFSRNRSATTGLTILKVVFTVFCFTWTLEKVEVRPAIISYIFSPSLLVVIIHSL